MPSTFNQSSLSACGGLQPVRSGETQELSPPSFEVNNPYPFNVRCDWQLMSKAGVPILIMPIRSNFSTDCKDFHLVVRSILDKDTDINLCLGRTSSNWTVILDPPVVVSFRTKENKEIVRPNFKVKGAWKKLLPSFIKLLFRNLRKWGYLSNKLLKSNCNFQNAWQPSEIIKRKDRPKIKPKPKQNNTHFEFTLYSLRYE